jgi:hypothetical protein
MVVLESPLSVKQGLPELAVRADRKPAIKPWAVVGALSLASYAYVIVKWGTSPRFGRVHSGTTRVPGYMRTGFALVEAAGFAATAFAIYRFVVLGVRVMARAAMRLPGLGRLGLIAVCFAVMAPLGMAGELLFARLGVYGYHSAIPSLSLFAGHYYQYPIYEPPILGAWLTAFSALLCFKDDRGNTLVERGMSESAARLDSGSLCGSSRSRAPAASSSWSYTTSLAVLRAQERGLAAGRANAHLPEQRNLRNRCRPRLPIPQPADREARRSPRLAGTHRQVNLI